MDRLPILIVCIVGLLLESKVGLGLVCHCNKNWVDLIDRINADDSLTDARNTLGFLTCGSDNTCEVTDDMCSPGSECFKSSAVPEEETVVPACARYITPEGTINQGCGWVGSGSTKFDDAGYNCVRVTCDLFGAVGYQKDGLCDPDKNPWVSILYSYICKSDKCNNQGFNKVCTNA